jgi:hypothetical protein
VWAEDGFVYFQQARRQGAFDVLFRGYVGYLQLPQRLLGAVSTLVPIRFLPVYFALAGTVVAALLAWFVYIAADEWVASKTVRIALGSLVVVMPALGAENTANITNLIWVLAAVAPWALISLVETRRFVAVRSVVALLAATSTALCVVFVPLAIGFAAVRRTRAAWVVAGSFCVGLTVQAAVVLHTETPAFPNQGPHPGAVSLVYSTSVRVFAIFLVGNRGASAAWDAFRPLLLTGSTVLVAVLFAAALVGAQQRRQVLAVVLAAYGVISFVVPVWGRRVHEGALGFGLVYDVSRFSVIPVMMLASAFAVLVTSPGRRAARVAQWIFIVQVVAVTLTSFSVTNLRSTSPAWSASVEETYRRDCMETPSNRLVHVPIIRQGLFPPGFFQVTVTCRDLTK